jgi:hypothetical protein
MKRIAILILIQSILTGGFLNSVFAVETKPVSTQNETLLKHSADNFNDPTIQNLTKYKKLKNKGISVRINSSGKRTFKLFKRIFHKTSNFLKLLFKLYIVPFLLSGFFLILKSSSAVTWPWIWVFSPLWIATVLYILTIILLIILLRNKF